MGCWGPQGGSLRTLAARWGKESGAEFQISRPQDLVALGFQCRMMQGLGNKRPQIRSNRRGIGHKGIQARAESSSDAKRPESGGSGGPVHSPLPGLGPDRADGSSRAGRWWWRPRVPHKAAAAAKGSGGSSGPGGRWAASKSGTRRRATSDSAAGPAPGPAH